MNKKKWDSLNPEQKKIITEAAHGSLIWQRAESVRLEERPGRLSTTGITISG